MRTAAAPPALAPGAVRALAGVVGHDHLITEPDRLLVYESDGLTQYRHRPAAVVLPSSADEVRRVVEILAHEELTFVPRGAGTGLSGGALAVDGAVVVGTARLNRILSVDPGHRRARVEPGVVNAHLTRAALPHRLIYAPDPSSQSACTLGGNVAENSGGPHCLKYGVTTRYVTALTVILPNGESVRLARDDDGPDLLGVFVGSEGCFGIAVEIEVALVPAPEGVRTLLALFDDLAASGRAVTDIMACGLLPAALEIVDRETIRAVESSVFAAGYPTDVEAALVVEFDGMEAGLDDEVARAEEMCRAAGARDVRVATSEAERQALWRGRKKAFGAMGRIAPDLLVQDATVPRSRLPGVLARVGEIGQAHGLTVANVFHAGDGNLHPNLLFDRRDPDQLARVERASREIMKACIDAGGTITGEHGVGLDKRQYMGAIHTPDVLEAMAAVKEVFDPEWRCNPGKVLPDEHAGPERAGRAPAGGRAPAARTANGLDPLVARLASELGPDAVSGAWITPSSPEELAIVMRLAGEAGVQVRPVSGHRTGSDGGVLLLSTRRLAGVRAHSPEDLTVTAGAGTTLAELRDGLADAGQWLPTDPPGGGARTIGGAFAAGEDGPLQTGYGRLRDHVLGLTLVDGAGRVLPLGGKVVKNVAGFDLVRLMAGSRGALGIVTELTLRLFPIPEADRTLLWEVDGSAAGSALRERILALGVPLAAVELVGARAEISDVAVRLTGSRASVAEMERRLGSTGGAPTGVHDGAGSEAWWEARARGLPGRGAHSGERPPGSTRAPNAEPRVGPHPAGGDQTGRRIRAALRADLVAAFDPRSILPGTWREGWR